MVLELTSADVIHSFWAPNLTGKRDLIPGRPTSLAFRADRAGHYRVQCAEFCGLQHAHMAMDIVAEAGADFDAWRQRRRALAPPPESEQERHGQQVFLSRECVMCHRITGTSANATNGPDLAHIADRMTIAAGTLPNTRGHRAGWIVDPQAIKPGAKMPATQLSPDELQALLAYLDQLH